MQFWLQIMILYGYFVAPTCIAALWSLLRWDSTIRTVRERMLGFAQKYRIDRAVSFAGVAVVISIIVAIEEALIIFLTAITTLLTHSPVIGTCVGFGVWAVLHLVNVRVAPVSTAIGQVLGCVYDCIVALYFLQFLPLWAILAVHVVAHLTDDLVIFYIVYKALKEAKNLHLAEGNPC